MLDGSKDFDISQEIVQPASGGINYIHIPPYSLNITTPDRAFELSVPNDPDKPWVLRLYDKEYTINGQAATAAIGEWLKQFEESEE